MFTCTVLFSKQSYLFGSMETRGTHTNTRRERKRKKEYGEKKEKIATTKNDSLNVYWLKKPESTQCIFHSRLFLLFDRFSYKNKPQINMRYIFCTKLLPSPLPRPSRHHCQWMSERKKSKMMNWRWWAMHEQCWFDCQSRTIGIPSISIIG